MKITELYKEIRKLIQQYLEEYKFSLITLHIVASILEVIKQELIKEITNYIKGRK